MVQQAIFDNYNLLMFGNQRPEFKNFPLSAEDIREINQTKQDLTKQISANQKQIQQLMTRTAQNNYEMQLLKRLKEKSMILQQKMRQNEEMLRLQFVMEHQVKTKKAQSLQIRKALGQEYKNAMAEKKAKEEMQREQGIMMERAVQKKNEEIEQQVEKRRKLKQEQRKREYLASLQVMQLAKKEVKRQNERNKREINEAAETFVRNDEEFLKHYKQYKKAFFDTSPSSPPKNTQHFNGIVSNTVDEKTMQLHINNMQKYKRDQRYKVELQDSLKQQMEEKEFRKQKQRQEHRLEKQMTDLFVQRNSELDRYEKQRKRQLQKQYEQDLSNQLKMKGYLANRQQLPSKMDENWRSSSRNAPQDKWSSMAVIGTHSLH